MINKLISKLNSFSEIKDYRISKVNENNNEIYYILDKVETARKSKLNSTCSVTIYCDDMGKRGNATFTVFDSYSDEEIENKIKEAIKQTKFSMNTYFDLPSGETRVFGRRQSELDPDIPFRIAEAVLRALPVENGWISCFEIFVKEKEVRIVNSRGVDYTYFTNSVFLEIIPTFKREDGEEIELYNALDYENIDYDKITIDTREILQNASLRNKAVKYTGPSTIDVILDAPEINEILLNLIENFDYGSVYNHLNMMNIGDSFYGENHLDAPDITLVPHVYDSVLNRDVDADGILLKATKVIGDNKILTYHGDNRNAYYLGIKEPTGVLPNMYVESGSYSVDELKREPHLHAIAFSSFQFDLYSGNFGGEVRLAIYFDGEKYIPVTGLTIGGNIHELKSHMKFTRERKNIKGYSGPKHVLIEKMNSN